MFIGNRSNSIKSESRAMAFVNRIFYTRVLSFIDQKDIKILKVSYFTYSRSIGGAAKGAERILNLMKSYNVEVYAQDSSTLGNGIGKVIAGRSRILNQRARVKASIPFVFLSFFSLSREAREGDIVFLNWLGNGHLSLLDYNRLNGKTIVFLHDEWFYEGVLHYSIGQQSIIMRLLNYVIRIIKHRLISEEVVLICPSNFFKERLLKSYPKFRANRIEVINIPIDTSVYQRFKPKFNGNKYRIGIGLSYNSYGYTKGRDLIDLLFKDKDIIDILDDKFIFYFFGGGVSAQPYSLDSTDFKVFGYLDSEHAMSDFYNELDFIFVPSRIESYGQVVLEAMACGVIPITTRTGAHSDYILDKINGFFIHENSLRGLKTVFKELVNMEKAEYLKISAAAEDTVNSSLNNERSKLKLDSLLEEVSKKS